MLQCTLKKLGLLENSDETSRRPKLKVYDPTDFTCKNERNALPAEIVRKLTAADNPRSSQKYSMLLKARIANNELKGTYQPLHYKGVNLLVDKRIPTRDNFFNAETKASYRSEIPVSQVHDKLTAMQLNSVFSRETKENYLRKVISADQISSELTAKQVDKLLSQNQNK
jgi:hypothetical protein